MSVVSSAVSVGVSPTRGGVLNQYILEVLEV